MVLGLIGAALAGCEVADFDLALTAGEAAYLDGNAGELKKRIRRARRVAKCAQLDSERAARYYRVRALVPALDSDWEAVREAFRASIAAEPLLRLPPLLERDQRLHLAWMRAQEMPIEWTRIPRRTVNGRQQTVKPDTPHLD